MAVHISIEMEGNAHDADECRYSQNYNESYRP